MTSTATRRSTRLSGLSADDSLAGPSSRSSAASSVIPAARQKATGKERRLEDLLDDETRMDLSAGPFLPTSKPRTSKPASSSDPFASDDDQPPKPARPSRKPRKTIGEEAEDDFIFRRVDVPSSSSDGDRKRAQLSSSQRTFEPLPDEAIGETPIIRRNKIYRAGLDVHPNAQSRMPSSLKKDGRRRNSRRSSLRDGTAAYPHANVSDKELYRHCNAQDSNGDDLPVAVRLKQLIGWVLKRSLDAALGKTDPPESSRIPTFTQQEKELLSEGEESVKRVLEQLLADLNDGSLSIDWAGTNEGTSKRGRLQPHPRNVENRDAETRLQAMERSRTAEATVWTRELHRIEDYEAETQRLQELLDSKDTSTSDDDDDEVIEWTDSDLDESTLRQLKDARDALAWLDGLLNHAHATEPGTEQDPRWRDVEFKVDLLRSRSHQFSQLESLASRYVNTVSAQAAQALRDRTSSTAKTNQSGDKLERLLSGVRESRSEFGQMAREGMDVEEAFEPDESDAMDLLRALANS